MIYCEVVQCFHSGGKHNWPITATAHQGLSFSRIKIQECVESDGNLTMTTK